jgi:hypothetical protein
MADISAREILESASYLKAKEVIFNEINSITIDIDYSVFKKTAQEKIRLKDLKEDNKIARKLHYGENWKKYLNQPSETIGSVKIEGFILLKGIITTEKRELVNVN